MIWTHDLQLLVSILGQANNFLLGYWYIENYYNQMKNSRLDQDLNPGYEAMSCLNLKSQSKSQKFY